MEKYPEAKIYKNSVGRRPALALPAIGSTLEAFIVLLTMYFEWPIYVLFVGSAISGTCGFFTTMVLAIMAYIADTTDESDRSFRLGALFSATASLETLFNFIGAFIFNSMYPASLKFNFPGFVFFLGAMLLIIPLLLICCLRNPGSFMSKRDLFRSGQPDNMEKILISPGVSILSESSSSPLPSPTPDDTYQPVA